MTSACLTVSNKLSLQVRRYCLLSKQSPDASQHTVLLRVVWMVFRGDFEQGGEGSGVGVHAVSYPLSDLYSVSSFMR